MWRLFKQHHYLDSSMPRSAKCFVAFWRGWPVAFASVLYAPHGNGGWWREHRTVCPPDYQGVGIGNALAAFVARVMKATGRKDRSTTGNPAMIPHRLASPLWRLIRKPGLNRSETEEARNKRGVGVASRRARTRLTTGFEYVGPARPEDARRLGIL